MFAPAAVPSAVLARLNEAFSKAAARPDIRERIVNGGSGLSGVLVHAIALLRRMHGEGTVSGSVESGGIYRELRTTVPAQ